MVANIFFWWYSEGLVIVARVGSYLTALLSNFFSVKELIKTWFSPWKNDKLSASNASLSDQLKIIQLNFASRAAGFLVRSVVIGIAMVTMAAIWLMVLFSLTAWIVFPWLPILLPILAIGVVAR